MLTPGTTLWNVLADPSTGESGRRLRAQRASHLLVVTETDEAACREAAARAAEASRIAAAAASKAAFAARGGASLADSELNAKPPHVDALPPAARCAAVRAAQAFGAAAEAAAAARAAELSTIPLAQSPCARVSTANRF